MEFYTIVKVRLALKKLMEKFENVDNFTERDLMDSLDEWHGRTELLVHLLNLKKLELRKEELQKQK